MENLSLKQNQLKLTEAKQTEIDIYEDTLVKMGSKEASVIGKLLIDRKISKEVIQSKLIKL